METKMNLKKIGAALAAVAASAFVASNLSGCASTDMAAQNSTPATTQLQNSCKGMNCKGMAEEGRHHRHYHHHHHKHMHHNKHMHKHSHKAAEAAQPAKAAAPAKAKGSKCAGVAGQ